MLVILITFSMDELKTLGNPRPFCFILLLNLFSFLRHRPLLRAGEEVAGGGEGRLESMKSPAEQNCPSEQPQENSSCCFAVFLSVTLVRSWPAPPSAIWEILEDSVQSPALCDQSRVESKNMSCYRTPIVAVSTVILELITNPSKKKFLALHWSGSCWGDRIVPHSGLWWRWPCGVTHWGTSQYRWNLSWLWR